MDGVAKGSDEWFVKNGRPNIRYKMLVEEVGSSEYWSMEFCPKCRIIANPSNGRWVRY